MTLHPTIPEPPSALMIDRQARAWLSRLASVWRGVNPTLYGETETPMYDGSMGPSRTERIAELFAAEGMDGPLPHDRLDLIYAATRRENPSKEAFITLALMDFLEDYETLPVGERSAKLPYQLAWARAGYTLSERTGLPGGIFRARWPDVQEIPQ